MPLLGTLDKDLVILDGYVSLTGVGAIEDQSINGVTVTHSGTGEYTFTLDKTYNSLKFADLAFTSAVAADLVPQIKSFSGSSVVFRLLTGATPTNPSNVSGLAFICVAKNSSSSR